MSVIKRHDGPATRVIWIRALMIIALVCMLFSMGLWVYITLPSFIVSNTHRIVVKHQPPPVSDKNQVEVTATAKQYMGALLAQHYDVMWSMLHPQVQAIWPNQNAFVTYWKTRFHDYTLKGFLSGNVSSLPYWINPETMVQYNNVEMMPVSLQFVLKVKPLLSLAPQFLHPNHLFQNLPLIVQRSTAQNGSTHAGQWLILDGGPADLEAPILPPMLPASRTVHVPILMYHHISDVPTKNVLDLSLTVTPTIFNKQLDHLKARHYHSITFNQLFAALYYGGPLPTKPIILTFDDGYDDAYKFAYPALKAHGFSSMFYIITGKVGWKGQMTWDQMREMLVNGMQMGSHTIHHVDIGQVLLNSLAQAQQEVHISQVDMEQHLGIAIQQFCYPSGEPFRHGSMLLRRLVMALLAANGYVGATTDPGETGVIQSSKSPLALLRVRIDGRASLQNFMLSLP